MTNNNNDKKLFLAIDANAIVHRAFHAYPPTLALSDGTQTNAVYGFTTMFLEALRKYEPDYIACAFDTKAPTFRHKEYPDYKATRKPTDESLLAQMPMVEKVLKSFNVPIIKKEGYEADDILGTMANYVADGKWSSQNLELVILSGDKDLLQLIEDDVYVSLPKGSFKNLAVYDRVKTHSKYGYYPKQVVDFKGMVGDSSDNIPGIKGVGKKTANRLLDKYGDWEGIYENLSEISTRWAKLLKEGVEQGEFSRKLARIDQDVPISIDLENCLLRDFAKQDVVDLFVKYEFKSLIDKVPNSLEDDQEAMYSNGEQMGLFGSAGGVNSGEESSEDQSNGVEELDFDEIKGLATDSDDIVIAYMDEEVSGADNLFIIRFKKDQDGEILKTDRVIHNLNGKCKQALTLLKECFSPNQVRETCIYNWEELVSQIESEIDDSKTVMVLNKLSYLFFDIRLSAHMLSAGDKGGYTLGDLAFKYKKTVGKETYHVGEASYVLDLVEDIAEAQKKEFKARSKAEDSSKQKWLAVIDTVNDLYDNLDGFKSTGDRYDCLKLTNQRFSVVLSEMENRGIRINCDLLKEMVGDLDSQIKEIESQAYKVVGHEFNLASPKQLAEVLYDELGLETPGKRKRTTKESVLRELEDTHPLIGNVLEYRELSKILSTYVKPFLEQAETEGDIRVIKTNFLQTGTSSGRLSSQDPNLQNLPSSGKWANKFRNSLLPREGFKLVSVDYSQIESRIMADFSEDETLIDDFKSGKDIHTATASRIFEKDESEISSDERKVGKTINFGILYGQTAYGLANQLKIGRQEAAEYIDGYFSHYKGVAEYIDSVGKIAQRRGYVETMFGRRRYVRGLNSRNSFARAAAIREAVNMPMQGSASEIMKLAMLLVDKELNGFGCKYNGKVFMVIQVHDEIIFEVAEDVLESFEPDVCQLMKGIGGILEFKVPLDVHFNSGDMLSELK